MEGLFLIAEMESPCRVGSPLEVSRLSILENPLIQWRTKNQHYLQHRQRVCFQAKWTLWCETRVVVRPHPLCTAMVYHISWISFLHGLVRRVLFCCGQFFVDIIHRCWSWYIFYWRLFLTSWRVSWLFCFSSITFVYYVVLNTSSVV